MMNDILGWLIFFSCGNCYFKIRPTPLTQLENRMYLIFAGLTYYPFGGSGDLQYVSDNESDAHEAWRNFILSKGFRDKYDWFEFVKVENNSWEVIEEIAE